MVEENTATQNQGPQGNVTAALTYLVGWITGLIFLLMEKEDKFVRFNAAQSLVFFGGMNVLFFIPIVGQFLGVILVIPLMVLWVYLMVKAYKGEEFRLPVIQDVVKKVEQSVK